MTGLEHSATVWQASAADAHAVAEPLADTFDGSVATSATGLGMRRPPRANVDRWRPAHLTPDSSPHRGAPQQ